MNCPKSSSKIFAGTSALVEFTKWLTAPWELIYPDVPDKLSNSIDRILDLVSTLEATEKTCDEGILSARCKHDLSLFCAMWEATIVVHGSAPDIDPVKRVENDSQSYTQFQDAIKKILAQQRPEQLKRIEDRKSQVADTEVFTGIRIALLFFFVIVCGSTSVFYSIFIDRDLFLHSVLSECEFVLVFC